MPIVKVLCQFEGVTGDPKDRYVNTWHFLVASDPPSQPHLEDIRDALNSFYGTDTEQITTQEPAGERSVFDYIGEQVAAGPVHSFKFYNMDDPKPRQPILTTHPNLAPGNQAKLPAEVAVVLSFSAPPDTGDNVQRGRGRVYIGPLNMLAIENGTADARVSVNLRNTLAKALRRMAWEMPDDVTPVIYSAGARAVDPATGKRATGALLPPDAYIIEVGYIDDSFDTQRRRGQASTSRTLVTND